MFNYLADVICLIIKFDSILEHSQLKNLWPHYVNAIQIAEQNQRRCRDANSDKTGDDANGLRNVFFKIDYLISGNLFQVHFGFLCFYVAV